MVNNYQLRTMNYKLPTTVICRLSSVVCLLSSALYICRESSTNQPFLCKTNPILSAVGGLQMNVSIFLQMDYENISNWTIGQNKPNSNPIKPNLRKAKMNVNLYVIEDYRKKDDFTVRINKPNFQNAKNERKLNFNKGLQKKRCFRSPKNKPNSNPISSKAKMNLKSLAKKSGHTLVGYPTYLACNLV